MRREGPLDIVHLYPSRSVPRLPEEAVYEDLEKVTNEIVRPFRVWTRNFVQRAFLAGCEERIYFTNVVLLPAKIKVSMYNKDGKNTKKTSSTKYKVSSTESIKDF